MNQLSRQVRQAIAALQHCQATCFSMAMIHSLEMGGEHARPQHLRLMLDCAAFCAFVTDTLGRKSQFHNRFAALCAEVCETCAKDCEALGGMDDCVTACRDCARHCTGVARLDHAELLEIASQIPPGRLRVVSEAIQA